MKRQLVWSVLLFPGSRSLGSGHSAAVSPGSTDCSLRLLCRRRWWQGHVQSSPELGSCGGSFPTWRRLSEDADLLQGSLWLSPWLLHATGSPQTNSIQLQLHRSGFCSLHLKPDLNTTFVLVFKNRSLSSFKKKQT